MNKTVILSDSKPCKVQVLGLFELDKISSPLGPFTYSVLTATGDIYEDEYIFPEEAPISPDKPIEECLEDDYEYHQWREYNTYQAAIAHEKKRTEDYERYLREVSQYVLKHCINEEDQLRIIESADFEKIQKAAIVPQIGEDDIAQILRDTFQGIVW